MATAVLHPRYAQRPATRLHRRAVSLRALGDDSPIGGDDSNAAPDMQVGSGGGAAGTSPGTISVPQLQQQNAAGAFNNLNTPYPYFGWVGSNLDPYATAEEPGFGGSTVQLPMNYSPTAGGFGVTPGAVNPAATSSAGSASTSSGSGSITGILGTPIYSGSSITWGWLLIGGLLLWLLLR